MKRKLRGNPFYQYDPMKGEVVKGQPAIRLAIEAATTRGIKSNYREWKRWKANPSVRRVPVLFSIPGLIVVMKRYRPHELDNRPNHFIFNGNHNKSDMRISNPKIADLRVANLVKTEHGYAYCDYGGIYDPVVEEQRVEGDEQKEL